MGYQGVNRVSPGPVACKALFDCSGPSGLTLMVFGDIAVTGTKTRAHTCRTRALVAPSQFPFSPLLWGEQLSHFHIPPHLLPTHFLLTPGSQTQSLRQCPGYI